MREGPPRKLVVTVRTSDGDAVLEDAAAEARRRGYDVHLVHVVSPALVGPSLESLVIRNAELHLRGRAVLQEAATRLEDLLSDDDVDVTTELVRAEDLPVLITESADA